MYTHNSISTITELLATNWYVCTVVHILLCSFFINTLLNINFEDVHVVT